MKATIYLSFVFHLCNGFSFKAPASSLLDGLSADERTNVKIYQTTGPAVAYVTSVVIPRGKSTVNVTDPSKGSMGLGSGSGFLVEDDGYIITNYHVIQRAWRMNAMGRELGEALFPSFLYGEDASSQFSNLPKTIKSFGMKTRNRLDRPRAQVLVRINSSTEYTQADIVDVIPELDAAVLKISISAGSSLNVLPLGSSSDLLVGQSVVAIGNPFGLEGSLTTGIVSALNREVTGIAGNQIRNCIQTDAAINPGNSGNVRMAFFIHLTFVHLTFLLPECCMVTNDDTKEDLS